MSRKRKNISQLAKKDYTVLIAIPSHMFWMAEFGMSLTMLMSFVSEHRLAPDARSQRIYVSNLRGSILPSLRQKLVDYAKKASCTHILFIDSDMVFPKDLMHRLIGHRQQVVACNCPTKAVPSAPTARLNTSKEHPGGDPVYSLGRMGLQQVDRVGTGIMLIDMRVFEKLSHPYFSTRWAEEAGDFVGEDWSLCENLNAAGVPIFIDHALSEQIGHVGDFRYTHQCIVTKEEEARVREALSA